MADVPSRQYPDVRVADAATSRLGTPLSSKERCGEKSPSAFEHLQNGGNRRPCCASYAKERMRARGLKEQIAAQSGSGVGLSAWSDRPAAVLHKLPASSVLSMFYGPWCPWGLCACVLHGAEEKPIEEASQPLWGLDTLQERRIVRLHLGSS